MALDLRLDQTSVTGSRAERLAAALERTITDRSLGAGDAVGTLEDVRAASGLSKPTVSEAVRLLRDRGVLEIRPGRGGGLFVAERGPVVRLRHTLLHVDEDPAAVVDAIELRDHLELLVDLGAARCRDEHDMADLRRHVATMAAADDWPTFMAANWALHTRIAAICPNAMARAVYIGTLGHLSGSVAHYADGAESLAYRQQRHADHHELVEAICSGDERRVRAAVARHHAAPEDHSTARPDPDHPEDSS